MVVADSHTRPVDSDRRSRLGRINTLTAEQAGLIALMRLSSKCVEGWVLSFAAHAPDPASSYAVNRLRGRPPLVPLARAAAAWPSIVAAASLSRGSREQARAERPLHESGTDTSTSAMAMTAHLRLGRR